MRLDQEDIQELNAFFAANSRRRLFFKSGIVRTLRTETGRRISHADLMRGLFKQFGIIVQVVAGRQPEYVRCSYPDCELAAPSSEPRLRCVIHRIDSDVPVPELKDIHGRDAPIIWDRVAAAVRYASDPPTFAMYCKYCGRVDELTEQAANTSWCICGRLARRWNKEFDGRETHGLTGADILYANCRPYTEREALQKLLYEYRDW